MLTLTPEAATGIRNLIDRPDVPDTAGLRIANDGDEGELTLSLVATPAEQDLVLDESGARLFLDADAAMALDEKVLDMAAGPDGAVQFSIGQQPG
jgi:Fe-S cluster assembly iron-binding protein IscA